ncbi:MAG: hypothetical protein EA398_02405 [Deltaproteobacteria bacterium]|nr:MAG: hypothetical protein EA398_02405 [Deltaproteobacteria bacterium]
MLDSPPFSCPAVAAPVIAVCLAVALLVSGCAGDDGTSVDDRGDESRGTQSPGAPIGSVGDSGPATDAATDDVSAGSSWSGSSPVPASDASDARVPWPLLNLPPVLASMPDLVARPGVERSFVPTAWDSEGSALTFFATGLPAEARLDSESGRLTWRPLTDEALAGHVREIELGVMDAEGAETRRRLSLRVEGGTQAQGSGRDPRIVVPTDGLPWPSDQPWRVGLDVRDGGPGPWRFSLVGRTPGELELDTDSGILSWEARGLEPGSRVPLTIRFTNGTGRTSEHELALVIEPGRFDALPDTPVRLGREARIDVVPERSDASCNAVGEWSEGVVLRGCEVRIPGPRMTMLGQRDSVRVAIASGGEVRWRDIPWRVVPDAGCPGPSELVGGLPSELALDALVEAEVTLCAEDARRFEQDVRLTADARWVEVFLELPPELASRTRLSLDCGGSAEPRSMARSGGTLGVRQRVDGATACTVTVESARALDRDVPVLLGVRAGAQPLCTRADGADTIVAGELIARRICPGETLRFTLDGAVDHLESTLHDVLVDHEWLWRFEDGAERVLASRLGQGRGERLWPVSDLEWSEPQESGERVLRLTAWRVPWRGGDLVLRTGERSAGVPGNDRRD